MNLENAQIFFCFFAQDQAAVPALPLALFQFRQSGSRLSRQPRHRRKQLLRKQLLRPRWNRQRKAWTVWEKRPGIWRQTKRRQRSAPWPRPSQRGAGGLPGGVCRIQDFCTKRSIDTYHLQSCNHENKAERFKDGRIGELADAKHRTDDSTPEGGSREKR